AAVRESGASSKKDFGKTMKLLTERLAGQAEPRRISGLLAKLLV
ncbi:MAG: GatB/YqeY domain-containing protein, partial [Candidatus Omnitrophica bacterium]|nr:GatB/YqeY domain-containing protein [Candidatus Omnitrophota bacterium]